MCCVCGGGAYTDDTSDDDTSTDITYGTVYDEDDIWVGYWYLNQTDTEDGYLNYISNEETFGYWTYDDDSTESGTWWYVNYIYFGTWYTSASNSTVIYIVEATPDGSMIYETQPWGSWFYNDTQTGGHWVNTYSTDSGFWEQD